MKRKILSLFLCSVMLVGFILGYGTDKSTANTSLSSSTVLKTGYKTTKPSKDGWTIEKLMSITYIYGEQLSYPITVNSFPDIVKDEDFYQDKSGDTIVIMYS